MNIPTKTLQSGFSLPVYGLGTWMMGGGMESDTSDDARYIAGISAAVEHGITHIDTAEMYGGGHAEELVREGISGADRSKLILTSKVSKGMAGGYDGVLRAAEASLQRLGTDYMDLYLLHSYPQSSDSLEEIMRAMDRLVSEGMVKDVGVCNMTTDGFAEAQKYTANKLVCNQVHFSVQMRESVVRGVLEYCQTNDVFLTAWGALEKGSLEQGNFLQEIGRKYDKTPYQVALNWIMQQSNVVTIPKTTSVEHLEENLGALGWELSAEDMKRLTDEFPNQETVSSRVSLGSRV